MRTANILIIKCLIIFEIGNRRSEIDLEMNIGNENY